jgi:hypothetical protein
VALEIPHLAFPFRWGPNGHAAANEQGSPEDVLSCVSVALVCPPAYRVDEPDFGARPEEMGVLPTDLDGLIRVIERSEPRARIAISERGDLIPLLESHLGVYVDRAEEA